MLFIKPEKVKVMNKRSSLLRLRFTSNVMPLGNSISPPASFHFSMPSVYTLTLVKLSPTWWRQCYKTFLLRHSRCKCSTRVGSGLTLNY